MKTKEWIEFVATKLLEFALTIGFFWTLFRLIDVKADATTIGILLGVLATGFITLINYKWGSSAGSQKKTDALIKNTETTLNENK